MPTPSIPLTSVLSLQNLSFNLKSVSKLTRARKCYISFFPYFYLFQDLMTQQIIGRGHEFGGLYILDPTVPRPIACSGVTTQCDTLSAGSSFAAILKEIVSSVFEFAIFRL